MPHSSLLMLLLSCISRVGDYKHRGILISKNLSILRMECLLLWVRRMKLPRVLFTICLFVVAQISAAQSPPALGVKITTPFMPYSATSSQIIYLTNPSTNDVNVVVNGFDEQGNQWDLGVVGVAQGRRVLKLASQINTALANEGFTGGKMTLEFTLTNAAVRGYFSYNAGSVRGFTPEIRELFPLSGQSTNAPANPALGVKITCPYMPYSSTASQIIYLINPSTRTTDIKVKAYDETGTQYDLGIVGTANGRTVTKLTQILSQKLLEKGFPGTGKITFEFDLDNPEIIGHFEYNAGSVRGYVEEVRELYVLPPANP